jgi:hypothetical protein
MLLKVVATVVVCLVLIPCAATILPKSALGQVFSFGVWGDMSFKKTSDDAKLKAVLKNFKQSDIYSGSKP